MTSWNVFEEKIDHNQSNFACLFFMEIYYILVRFILKIVPAYRTTFYPAWDESFLLVQGIARREDVDVTQLDLVNI